MHRISQMAALTVLVGAASAWAQLPIPVPGQNPPSGAPAGAPGGRGGGRGGRGAQPAAPVKQVAAPIPAAVEVTGPGEFFETFMDDYDDAKKAEIPAKDTYAKFNYEAREYFISGTTSSGMPYKTRIVIRKPKDNTKFNGLILAESMHPSGNPWVFHFTQIYAMTTGVIGLEILTTTPAGLAAANEARYKDLVVPNGAANDILAQVGALIKSDHKDNPLSGLAVRKMILAGSSASAAVAQNYLSNAHMAQRLADMKPIYDGFMPTSANGQIPVIDVPTILVPTMRETFAGSGTTQPDNEKASRLRICRHGPYRFPRCRRNTTPIPANIRSAGIPWERKWPLRSTSSSRGWTRASLLPMPTGFTSISIRTTSRSSTAIRAFCSHWMNLETSKAESATPMWMCR